MKKIYFTVPILGLLISCSGGNKQEQKTTDDFQEQIEVIENSTRKLDESLDKSDYEIEKNQNEIDSLLNDI